MTTSELIKLIQPHTPEVRYSPYLEDTYFAETENMGSHPYPIAIRVLHDDGYLMVRVGMTRVAIMPELYADTEEMAKLIAKEIQKKIQERP
jgi:hypothetical protein